MSVLLKWRALTLLLVGCASAPLAGQRDWLDFLSPGMTTRQLVTERLGSPDAVYEGGRIVAYWIAADEGGYYKPRQGRPPQYSLIVVFRGGDVLDRHSLVKVGGD